MMSYEETMAYGAAQYRDILNSLATMGLRADFIQTGGMNAAIMVALEAGHYLLIADREESLSWERVDHAGWYVGLYRDVEEAGTEPLRWSEADGSDFEALSGCIGEVLHPDRELG